MKRAISYLTSISVYLLAVAVCALAAIGQAHAQITNDPPSCAPAQFNGGTGSVAVVRVTDSPVGMCARWWCPPSSGLGAWVEGTAFFLPSYFLQSKRDEYIAAAERGDMAWLIANRTLAPTNSEYMRCANDAAFVARSLALKPRDMYPYRVAPNPSSTSVPQTRPAYKIVNGVRVTGDGLRAVVGEGCRPDIARIDVDYMAFGPLFAADIVAICK